MPPTSVNRLNNAARAARDEYYTLMSRRWGPRWTSWRVSMVHGNAAARLNANLAVAHEKMEKANEKLNEAMNRNAQSLQAQLRELARVVKALYHNHEVASNALQNLNARARRATNETEKAAIEKQKIPHKVVLKRYRTEKATINAKRNEIFKNQSRLLKAIDLRRRIIHRAPTEEQARQRIGKFLSRTIVARTTHGPYGTRTLEAMRRYPEYKDPTLENYATARREIDRLRAQLTRKRSPNRSPNRSPKSQRK